MKYRKLKKIKKKTCYVGNKNLVKKCLYLFRLEFSRLPATDYGLTYPGQGLASFPFSMLNP